jgi:hypothetical protein
MSAGAASPEPLGPRNRVHCWPDAEPPSGKNWQIKSKPDPSKQRIGIL